MPPCPSDDELPLDRPLLDHLLSLLTERRRERFATVLAQRTRKITVVLENVSQSHNFSAVMRSCDCFGVQDVTALDPRGVFGVSKDVAMGAEKWLTTHHHKGETAVADGIRTVKRQGYRVLVTSPHGESVPISEVPVDVPTAIVFGTELAGITDEMESLADGRVHIPMVGFTESFNVSVAAAICLADLTRRLRDTTDDWALTNDEKDRLLLTWARRSINHIEQVEARFHAERAAASSTRDT